MKNPPPAPVRDVAYEPDSLAERQYLAEVAAVVSGRYAHPSDDANHLPPLPPRGVLALPPTDFALRTCATCSRTLHGDPYGFIDHGQPCFMCWRAIQARLEAA